MSLLPFERPEPHALATRADTNRLEALMNKLLNSARPPRRFIIAETKVIHIRTVRTFFGGMCPCCMEQQIVDGDRRLPNSEFDHWSDNPSKSAPHETWLICRSCNADFSHGKRNRQDFIVEWNMFQKRRKQIAARSQPLLL